MASSETTASQSSVRQHPMVDAPFPLRNGATAWVRFPRYGWTADDVGRFVDFVLSMISTQPDHPCWCGSGKPSRECHNTQEPAQAGDSEEGV